MSRSLLLGICVFFNLFVPVSAEWIDLSWGGDHYTVEVDPGATFGDVSRALEEVFGVDAEDQILRSGGRRMTGEREVALMASQADSVKVSMFTVDELYRDYDREITPSEYRDLTYILVTMSDKSLVKLAMYRKDLHAAGDRIDSLHPLQFLATIFLDERLKVSIRNIRHKGWVWDEFMTGLADGLEEESMRENLREEHIRDFASRLEIDPGILFDPIERRQWVHLVDTLIKEVPRKGNPGRYDM